MWIIRVRRCQVVMLLLSVELEDDSHVAFQNDQQRCCPLFVIILADIRLLSPDSRTMPTRVLTRTGILDRSRVTKQGGNRFIRSS